MGIGIHKGLVPRREYVPIPQDIEDSVLENVCATACTDNSFKAICEHFRAITFVSADKESIFRWDEVLRPPNILNYRLDYLEIQGGSLHAILVQKSLSYIIKSKLAESLKHFYAGDDNINAILSICQDFVGDLLGNKQRLADFLRSDIFKLDDFVNVYMILLIISGEMERMLDESAKKRYFVRAKEMVQKQLGIKIAFTSNELEGDMIFRDYGEHAVTGWKIVDTN